MDTGLLQANSWQDAAPSGFGELIKHSLYGDVLQTEAWARLKSTSGWKSHFVQVTKDGQPIAECVVLERKLPKIPFTLLYCPRGPVLDWDYPEALSVLIDELKSIGRKRRAILIKVDPAVPIEHPSARRDLELFGFRAIESDGFGGTQPRCVMKLDLSQGLEAALEGFKPKWRYNIRLAEKKGVIAREASSDEIDVFYDILLDTAKRDRFLVRGREYFRSMWRELSADGMIRLFLTEFEGKPLSGALMYVLGKQAWYTYGASSNEHRNLMPNHLMQWRMMEAAFEAGCSVYDFRGVSCNREEMEGDNLGGLNRFKQGFGAEFIEYIGEFDLPLNPIMYFAWTKAAPAAMKLLKKKAQSEGD